MKRRSNSFTSPTRIDARGLRRPASLALACCMLGLADPALADEVAMAAPPIAASSRVEPGEGQPWWFAGFQSTYILQRKQGFDAAYTGPHSLLPTAETGYTLTATAFLGLRLWEGAEVAFNPEIIQSEELSNLTGLGGLTNGENQKGGGPLPNLYRARVFVRQTLNLGGELSNVEPGPNQLGGPIASRRLVVTAGNFAVIDVFDANAYSHDPRTQFMNWAFMTYAASDFAADSRGFTWGLSLEYFHDDWAARLGRFAQPRQSNGLALDPDLLRHYGDSLELEHRHQLFGLPGKLRVAGWRNYASMGSFRDALQYASVNGGTPSVANVRRDQSKYGAGFGVEQGLPFDAGLFARASFNDGRTETYAFTEIERSFTVGLSVKGVRWHRAGDTLGLAWAVNGLSDAHRDYLAAGGLGFFLGDGRLSYRPEQILEGYYNLAAFHGLWFTLDAQHIANPAYNRDRGPVNVVGCRFHAEY